MSNKLVTSGGGEYKHEKCHKYETIKRDVLIEGNFLRDNNGKILYNCELNLDLENYDWDKDDIPCRYALMVYTYCEHTENYCPQYKISTVRFSWEDGNENYYVNMKQLLIEHNYIKPLILTPVDELYKYFCDYCNVRNKCTHDYIYHSLCLTCGFTIEDSTKYPDTVTNLYDFIFPNSSLPSTQLTIPKPYVPKHKLKSMIRQLKTNINNDINEDNDINQEQSINILQKLEYYINKL